MTTIQRTDADILSYLEEQLSPPDEDDPGNVQHIVAREPGGPPPSVVIENARENGTEVTGLCGYTWVPRFGVHAEHLPVCAKCRSLWSGT